MRNLSTVIIAALTLPAGAIASDPTGAAIVEKLAKTPGHGLQVKQIFTQPSHVGCYSMKYSLNEVSIQPGEALYFAVPEHLRSRPVTMGTLVHRQDPDSTRGATNPYSHDDYPAYNSFQVMTRAGQWRYWEAPWANGKWGPKFVEPRPYNKPETETLFDWGKLGTHELESGEVSRDPVEAQAIRVVSLEQALLNRSFSGLDPALVREISLQTYPGDSDADIEKVFSPGTNLGHPFTVEGQNYGGGPAFGGKYPSALALNPHGQNEYTIDLPAGHEILEVQVAAGDLHPDGVPNKDGGVGSLGWSKLSIDYQTATGATESWLYRENVGPVGSYRATPIRCGQMTAQGDRVIIRSDSDTAYVMALRVRLRKAR